jgi:hypothetical protein
MKATIVRKLLFLSVIILVSCQNPTVKKPEWFLAHDEMVAIMTDLQLADAYIADIKAKGTDVDTVTTKVHDSVFMIHSISRAVFDENLAWYSANIAELNKVYEDVLSNLEFIKMPTGQDTIPKLEK